MGYFVNMGQNLAIGNITTATGGERGKKTKMERNKIT
jgi:hypothetical protein